MAKHKDPVCGMSVDDSDAEMKTRLGKTYYFCGKKCKNEFSKHPAEYATEGRTRRHEAPCCA